MKQWLNLGHREKPKFSEKNLSQCHFWGHKSHMDWSGIEPGSPWRETGNYQPESHSQNKGYLRVKLVPDITHSTRLLREYSIRFEPSLIRVLTCLVT
jgi:hypothetical protein